jgi:hypothetical protein
MNLDRLIPPIDRFEFGVCIREGQERSYFRVPIQAEVEVVFQSSLENTIRLLTVQGEEGANIMPPYDPAAVHKTVDPCKLTLDDDCVGSLLELARRQDLEPNNDILSDNPNSVFFYFCRFTIRDHTFLAVRRANLFKANLNTVSAWFSGGTLELARGNVFRLDDFFDVLISGDDVYILRPNDFEYLADIESVLTRTASARLREADQKLPFLDLEPLAVQMETGGSIRRARLANSVARRGDLQLTDRSLFEAVCRHANVPIEERDGIFHPTDGDGWKIIAVLDRRRYWVDLIMGQHEIYEASNRVQV